MKNKDPRLLLFHAPLLRQEMTTPRAMRDVIYALLPATGAALYYFGISAILLLGASIAGAVAAARFGSAGLTHDVGGHPVVTTGERRPGSGDLHRLIDLAFVGKRIISFKGTPVLGSPTLHIQLTHRPGWYRGAMTILRMVALIRSATIGTA